MQFHGVFTFLSYASTVAINLLRPRRTIGAGDRPPRANRQIATTMWSIPSSNSMTHAG